MIKGLVQIVENDLKKSDKSGLKTLYLYWLENDKKMTFDLPLFVDTNGKGVLSVECFKRVFYAFCNKCSIAFDCEIISGSDGDDGSYNVVRLSARKDSCLSDVAFLAAFDAPKITEQKRESSKATREKSKARKAEAEKAEAEQTIDWNKKASMQIVDHLIGKYKMTCDRTALEKEIQNILNKIK